MPDPATIALRLRGVSKHFGSFTANDEVDLDIAWGEIHALLGENGAGKTTLMRIVTGLYEPDGGTLEVDGRPVRFRTPEQAMRAGIGMVHQHFTLVPGLTELENLAMRPARFPWRNDLAQVRRRAEGISRSTGLLISADRLVADASVGERQRLEIVKLLCRGARILIFDEPSAALSPGEWEDLAALMRRLADDGHAIILISHKLAEVFSVADRYTVLRQGAVAGCGALTDVTTGELVTMMVGDLTEERPPRIPPAPGPAVLRVRGLDVARDDEHGRGRQVLQDIDLDVRRGEIVGVAGVAGSGQAELVEAIVGMRPAVAGSVELAGEPFDLRTPRGYFARGGALIPEDRHDVAIVGEMAVWENIHLRTIRRPPFSRRGLLDSRAARSAARRWMAEFDVRAGSEQTPIGRLSGGNQQKAVLAREFADHPALLIAVQPVRGLDVRATDFVYRRLAAHREAGGGILLISVDLDEVLAMSDRIVVLAHGRITGRLAAREATRAKIGALMTASEAA
jgi:simple sugar transport system ATP-binding protein